MRNALSVLLRLVGPLTLFLISTMSLGLTPTNLKCEYQSDPLGIDTMHPRLSWWFDASQRNETQGAYQILVSSSLSKLRAGTADVWDSGRVPSDQSVHVEFAGKALQSNHVYFWTVRTWNTKGQVSKWSKPGRWITGLFSEKDWGGQWIAATATHSFTNSNSMYGFHALEASSKDVTKWVQIDLGASHPISEVVLHSPTPPGFSIDKGFGFPIRFKIEISDEPSFVLPKTIVSYLDRDFPNPGQGPTKFSANSVNGRFVRITATKLWNRRTGPEPYCFALSELQVFSNGKNVALHAPVTSNDSVENSDWNRKRLTDGEYVRTKSDVSDAQNGAVKLRKQVQISKKVARATAFVCGIGYSEFYVNGQKSGDHVLDPGFTDYSKRLLYITHDITKAIKYGKNEFEVLLGGGWFNLATPDLFGFEKAPWSASPRARVHVTIEYSDGTTQTVVSDRSWSWTPTGITFNCVRGGETIDARWSTPDWKNVTVVDAPRGILVSQQQPPIRITKTISPISVKEPKPGVYVFDLGTNIAGWASLKTHGPAGNVVTLKYNEELNPDGTANMRHTASHTYGRFQTEEFILSGKDVDYFEPRFTYHGFRYIEVTGLIHQPSLTDLEGKWVTTDPNQAGAFECSNKRLNQVQNLIVHAYLNNLHSIPTDCPQREKMGWMDDGCVDMETGFFNLDTAQFYRKWFNDMMDAQDANGHVPDIVPTSGWGRTRPNGAPGEMADPWWGGAIVLTPWKLYQNFGDKRVIQDGYPAMKAYVDYLGSTAKDHIVSWGLGDWLDDSAGGGGRRVPVEQTSTAGYYGFSKIVSSSAKILGKASEAKKYEALAESIKESFNAKYLDAATGRYAKDSQTAQALPLTLGLAPTSKRELVIDQLVESISGKRDNHISAGMIGSLYVFHALTENGRDDLAYKMMTQETYPGWLHMINSGSTSLWEAWNGDGSYNHPTLGCVGFWLYQGLAGIKPDPSVPGFKKFIVKPSIANDLTWVKAHYDSVHGRIESSWKKNGQKLMMRVVVPPNTQATIFVPSAKESSLLESGQPISKAIGIHDLRREKDYTVMKVGSGIYQFESTI